MSDDYDSGTGAMFLNATPSSKHKASATATAPETTETNTSSQIANGLSCTISTIIRDFDTQAQHTSRSQDHLSSAIHRLTRELDQLLADAPSPFIMQHAGKISSVRKRVLSLNSVLKSIQRRLDNIDRLVSAGLPNGPEVQADGSSN